MTFGNGLAPEPAILPTVPIFGMFSMNPTQTTTAFGCLELSPEINRQLDKLGFTTPTPIQAEAIPHALGVAQ